MHTDSALGPLLLTIAREAIAAKLGLAPGQTEPSQGTALQERLSLPGATFVTLTRNHRLRGCMGSLEARRPLGEDVAANARAAAFLDPRFSPLSATEWPEVRVEVSLLQPARMLAVASEAEALAKLHPGSDGVILTLGQRCATFLPQVWETLPDPRDFLGQLKRKAGLPLDFWSADLQLATYHVDKWKEN